MKPQSPEVAIAQLPLWVRASGAIILFGSALLSARLIWEQTVWTWRQGPQMVGFALAHGPGAILVMFPFLLVVWTVAVLGVSIRARIRKRQIPTKRWAVLALAVSLLVLPVMGEGFWERLFIGRMAASPRAGDLLVDAAYRGDLGVIRAFLSRGVPISARDRTDWRTSLHAAAVEGDTQAIQYLVSRGASVNAVDRFGDSPLELAASRGNDAAARLLTDLGAKRLRGDDAQRQRVIQDQAREALEALMPMVDIVVREHLSSAEREQQKKQGSKNGSQ